MPAEQREDARRRQESGQPGSKKSRLDTPEKGDRRRTEGGPGQQNLNKADADTQEQDEQDSQRERDRLNRARTEGEPSGGS